MASITIRNLDDDLKQALRLAAAEHGHSMEEEVRVILRRSLAGATKGGLGSRVRARFSDVGGAELDLPAHNETPRAADFD
jgi:plasmid stability protein